MQRSSIYPRHGQLAHPTGAIEHNMAGPLIRRYAGAQRADDFALSNNRVKLLWRMARTPRLARRSLALARLRNAFNRGSHIRTEANFITVTLGHPFLSIASFLRVAEVGAPSASPGKEIKGEVDHEARDHYRHSVSSLADEFDSLIAMHKISGPRVAHAHPVAPGGK
jgi:hypothetical protein